MVLVGIVGGIIFFSVQTGRLLTLMESEGAGTGVFANPRRQLFVLVCGDTGKSDLSIFLYEVCTRQQAHFQKLLPTSAG